MEAHVYAYSIADLFCDPERAFGLRHIHANRLFAVSVFTSTHRGGQMLNVKVGRSGNLDRVDAWRVLQVLISAPSAVKG